MQIIHAAIASIASFIFFEFFSKPGSKVNQKIPKIKIKNLQLLPSLKIIIKGRIIHLHHWFNFTIILCISVFITHGFLDSWITRGFLMGGIVQGLKFSDRGIFKRLPQ